MNQHVNSKLPILFIATLYVGLPASTLDKARVSEGGVARVACETLRMPAHVHRLDHATNHKYPAFRAAWSIEYVKVVLTVLATIELQKIHTRTH